MNEKDRSLAEHRIRKEQEQRRKIQEEESDRTKRAEEHKVTITIQYQLSSSFICPCIPVKQSYLIFSQCYGSSDVTSLPNFCPIIT